MDREIASAVNLFEEIEKLRRGCEAKLTHLAKNRKCMDCSQDWMPKKFEPCPECHSNDTKLMKRKRKCNECGHIWEPSALGVCPQCGSSDSRSSPKDDSYIREVALPRLRNEEDFYEDHLKKMIESHPAWSWCELIKGVGLTSIGRIIGKTDITRIETASEMFAHCGFGLYRDGTRQRKRRGETIDYDTRLQSASVMLGESLIKQGDSYYQYYLKQKKIHSALPTAHCHNRAFRHMIKLFLAHFWQTWREAEGLSAPLPYAFGILKHPEGHLITPDSMLQQPASRRKKKASQTV